MESITSTMSNCPTPTETMLAASNHSRTAGFITDRTHMEVCTDFKVGDRFERAGTSWYIYNADRGGRCRDNNDSIAYWMWYKGFRFSGGGDEENTGKKELVNNTSLDLDEFFPVDVRYENHHCRGPLVRRVREKAQCPILLLSDRFISYHR